MDSLVGAGDSLSRLEVGGNSRSFDNETRKLIQRSVILKRDERANGYGLTVTGDKPVFVASVREEGPAYRSGIRKNDRIIKVSHQTLLGTAPYLPK
ncbi:DgyrCDS9857 [Dimorphilus gyrociliatus]|uniref:DgyrCDS9857 n=1 Tax=Dimorphilus gyrociliatus TaxID=2664684 RepID=A0A7I8VZN4_9ANNE|nr:DgyrCDS9857 [Dimorphilus gyrociliatus]